MPSRKTTGVDEQEVAVPRKIVRFTLDLDSEQHRFLKLFSIENGIQSSVIMRALIYLVETDEELANRVIDEIFAE